MAKTILKKGPPNFITTCETCMTQFSYELGDVEGALVRCPQCGMNVTHRPKRPLSARS